MESSTSIRVVVVEDHIALRKGLELLLGRHGCVIVGTADSADDGYALIRAKQPDVAVVDVNLPRESGADLTRRLLRENPETGVLLYTGAQDQETLHDALDCGARGFAIKAGSPHELLEAIRTVAAGGSYVDPRLHAMIPGRSATGRIGVLSAREREVLDLLSRGLTGEQVAKQLFLSPETVRTHVRNAMLKLDARTRTHAIAIALQQGEISR